MAGREEGSLPLRRLGRRETTMLVLLLLGSAASWIFLVVASLVRDNDVRAFDHALLLALRHPLDLADPLGPPWLEELARDFTALGGAGVIGLLTLAVSGHLLLQGKRRAALFAVVSVGSGLLLAIVLKLLFGRPRPDFLSEARWVYSSSFPSGHSMLAAVAYLTLGALLARFQRTAVKAYLLSVAVFLTGVVGVSRVYLGVHWPTDVLAGWTAGAAWALLAYSASLWLQRRGELERAGDDRLTP